MDTRKRCASCALEIPLEARKCPHCRARQPGQSTFYRPPEAKMIAGVCAGIARELGVDPTVVRLGFVIAALVSIGIAFWGYVVLWAITPAARFEDPPLARAIAKIRRILAPAGSGAPTADRSADPQAL